MIWPHACVSPNALPGAIPVAVRPEPSTRPRGFEPLTFGSVDRAEGPRSSAVEAGLAWNPGTFRGRLRRALKRTLRSVSRRSGRDLATAGAS